MERITILRLMAMLLLLPFGAKTAPPPPPFQFNHDYYQRLVTIRLLRASGGFKVSVSSMQKESDEAVIQITGGGNWGYREDAQLIVAGKAVSETFEVPLQEVSNIRIIQYTFLSGTLFGK